MSQLEISPVESASESASEYSSFYVWTISGAAFVYVIVAFGLSAIPSLSRLALYASVMLLTLLVLSMGKLKLSLWMLVLTLFYLYLALPALALSNVPIYRLSTLTTVFLGTLSIGLALQNRILSYNVLTYGAIAAAIINIVAIFAGVETSSHDVEAIGRYSGLMGNANALAISMALAAFLIWLYPERFTWQIRALGIFLVLYGMYITGSIKGVLMAMALFALVFMNHLVKISMVRILAYLSAAARGCPGALRGPYGNCRKIQHADRRDRPDFDRFCRRECLHQRATVPDRCRPEAVGESACIRIWTQSVCGSQ
jgi:hypothetical protein